MTDDVWIKINEFRIGGVDDRHGDRITAKAIYQLLKTVR